MARKIDVSEAASWSDEEYAANEKYFDDRANYDALNSIRRVREAGPKRKPKTNVTDGTISEVLEWVGDDAEKAQAALDAENLKESPRKTLVDELETVILND